ncbi:MAG: DUF1475 family protein [Nevskiales bacterium]|nr:DUF1475 family protein [Nevskiales bacterium]
MTVALKAVFVVFLLTIVGVTGWAGSQVALWDTPRELVLHPWFIATLTDTYLAFLCFWLWIAYKERSFVARAPWFVLIMATGNIAMALYALIQLRKLPPDARIEDFLLRRT